jgi:hypothetical protein
MEPTAVTWALIVFGLLTHGILTYIYVVFARDPHSRASKDIHMDDLSLMSRISLYVLLALVAFLTAILLWFQAQVMIGKPMKNPDGSFDDWHRQRTHFGIAFADLFITCPVSVAAIVLTLQSSPWGHYLLTMVGFFYVWANTMTTATSLRFEKPTMTFMWFLVFPFGILVGLAIIAWMATHLEVVYVQ